MKWTVSWSSFYQNITYLPTYGMFRFQGILSRQLFENMKFIAKFMRLMIHSQSDTENIIEQLK